MSGAGVQAECLIMYDAKYLDLLYEELIRISGGKKKDHPPQKTITTVRKSSRPMLSPSRVSAAAVKSDSSLVHLLSGREMCTLSQTPPHNSFPQKILSPTQEAESLPVSVPSIAETKGPQAHTATLSPNLRPTRVPGLLSSLKGCVFSQLTPKLAISIVLHICRACQVLWATYFGNRQWNMYYLGFFGVKIICKLIFRFYPRFSSKSC